MLNWFKKNKFLVSVLLLTIILRLPSLFEPYWYGDEGIYLAIGMALKKGLFLYRDIYDNKPPLLYLIAELAGNLFWFRFALFLSCLASVVLLSKLTNIFFPGKKTVQRIVLLAFTILLNIPLIEGNIANAEIFQILPVLGAVYLLVKGKNIPYRDYFLSGLLFSIAVLLKVPAVLDFAAVVIFLVFFSHPQKVFNFEKKTIVLLAGFFLPLLLTFSFFFFNHYLKESFQIIFLQNFGYLSSWKTGSHKLSLLKSGLFQRSVCFFLFSIILYFSRKKIPPKWAIFINIWFSFTLFAALLSNRPYAHYLIQVLLPFCLTVGVIKNNKGLIRLFSIFLIFLLLTLCLEIKFWIYPVFSYYKNFLQFSLGQKSQIDYFVYFDKKVPQTYQIAFYLINSTRATDKVFVWGDEPYIFPLSQRLPASRLITAYHIIDFDKFQETEEQLRIEKPEIIIFDDNKRDIFTNIENLISVNYVKIWSVENLQIFRLKNKNED